MDRIAVRRRNCAALSLLLLVLTVLPALTSAQGELRGHTFHYSRFETSITPLSYTIKHANKEAGEAIYQDGNLQASYFHAYFTSNPAATATLFLKRP